MIMIKGVNQSPWWQTCPTSALSTTNSTLLAWHWNKHSWWEASD